MNTNCLGANIKKYRLEKGFTQDQAAEKCGLSSVYYRQIEQGNKVPRLETFLKIAEMLETPTDKLFAGNVSWTESIETYDILEKLNALPEDRRKEAISLLNSHIKLLQER